MIWLGVGVGYVLGVLTILAVEAAALLLLLRRFNRKLAQQQHNLNQESSSQQSSSSPDLDPSFYKKQGVVWILESEKVAKAVPTDNVSREPRRKKEILEVLPVQKYAKIKDHSLFISESDGSHTEVQLKGSIIVAVSATSLSSRKWAKKYPIKVESKKSKIYKGNSTFFVYLETSWEKEAWCKALRLASCDDKEKLKWFAKTNMEFHTYVTSLNLEYPPFMKPLMGFSADPNDKSIKIDGSSSKVRQFLKKLATKASKNGAENKARWSSILAHEERKINKKSHSFQDSGLTNMSSMGKPSEDIMVPSLCSASSESGSKSQISGVSDADSDERTFSDEGTLCWNLLLSRLFFDAKSNVQLKISIQARIQRMLSNMRSPSFIGDIACTAVDLGSLPPYIHSMRLLPSNMNELWAFEIDMEYAGGAILNVETRLEVRELDLQEGEGTTLDSSAVSEIRSDLLEGFEYFGKQLNLPEVKADELDGIGSHKSMPASSQVSRWKNMLHCIAKQVSQVPLSLGIKVSSLRGTMRVYIKPPPSDHIWFGFSSMPDIDFNLEPSVGEHKITSGHLALFLISKFKVAIRDTMVLPNCESIRIPWMLAENDDWVPQRVAPFMRIRPESASNSTTKQGSNSQSVKEKFIAEANRGTPNSYIDSKNKKSSNIEHVMQPENELSEQYASSSAPVDQPTLTDHHLNELTTPLLKVDEPGEIVNKSVEISGGQLPSQSLISIGQQNFNAEDDDTRPKRIGTRARMLGFGKKMGEKLEEKRKNIEERGRHIVERMKGP